MVAGDGGLGLILGPQPPLHQSTRWKVLSPAAGVVGETQRVGPVWSACPPPAGALCLADRVEYQQGPQVLQGSLIICSMGKEVI